MILALVVALGLTGAGALAEETEATQVPQTPAGPLYLSFTGVVDGITPHTNNDGTENPDIQYVLLKEEGTEALMTFVVDGGTLQVGEVLLEEGQKLTGFYNGNAPAIMIYPPRQPALVITPAVEGQQVTMAQFDEDLVSADGMLNITVDESTQVVDQAGAAYEGDLAGRVLVVIYGPSTRSIPAQATAIQVVVMEEEGAAGETQATEAPKVIADDSVVPSDAPELLASPPATPEPVVIPGDEIALMELPIVVNGKVLADIPAPFVNADGVMMVPALDIAKALNWSVENEEGSDLYVLSKVITFTVGKDHYTFASMPAIELGTVPVEEQGVVYVPLQFFTQVAKLNNAYVLEGQIVINNEAKMASQ